MHALAEVSEAYTGFAVLGIWVAGFRSAVRHRLLLGLESLQVKTAGLVCSSPPRFPDNTFASFDDVDSGPAGSARSCNSAGMASKRAVKSFADSAQQGRSRAATTCY